MGVEGVCLVWGLQSNPLASLSSHDVRLSVMKLRYIYSLLLVSGFSSSLLGTERILKSNNSAEGWKKL